MDARRWVLALAGCAMVAGCGGGGGAGSADEAIERCRAEAERLTGDAREFAEAACEAGESGNTTGVKDAAKELCLKQVQQIPDPAAKRQAEQACEDRTR